jgi:hypothetical protein
MDLVVPTAAYQTSTNAQAMLPPSTSCDPDPTVVPELLPIVVVIHNGDLVEGDGTDPYGLKNNMAISLNSVIITPNYRLGPLGFLPLGPNGGAAAPAPAPASDAPAGDAAATPAATPAARRRLQQVGALVEFVLDGGLEGGVHRCDSCESACVPNPTPNSRRQTLRPAPTALPHRHLHLRRQKRQ